MMSHNCKADRLRGFPMSAQYEFSISHLLDNNFYKPSEHRLKIHTAISMSCRDFSDDTINCEV